MINDYKQSKELYPYFVDFEGKDNLTNSEIQTLAGIILSMCFKIPGIVPHKYQLPPTARIIESLLKKDGNRISLLFARQCVAKNTVICDTVGRKTLIQNHPKQQQKFTGDGYFLELYNSKKVTVSDNTLVLTETGWTPVAEINIGDNIYSVSSMQERMHYGKQVLSKVETSLVADIISEKCKTFFDGTSIILEYEDLIPKSYIKAFDGFMPSKNVITFNLKNKRISKIFYQFIHSNVKSFSSRQLFGYNFFFFLNKVSKESLDNVIATIFKRIDCTFSLSLSKWNVLHIPQRINKISIWKRLFSMMLNQAGFRTTEKRHIKYIPHICFKLDDITPKPIVIDDITIDDGFNLVLNKIYDKKPLKDITFYDIEDPKSNYYNAQGILCHNSGKTECVSALGAGLLYLLPYVAMLSGDKRVKAYKNGFAVGIFSPSGRQAQEIRRRMLKHINSPKAKDIIFRDLKLITTSERKIKTKDYSDIKSLNFNNGSMVIAASADPKSNIQTFSLDLAILEEAHHMDDDQVNVSILPMMGYTGGTTVAIGTVCDNIDGFFKNTIDYNKKNKPENHFEYDYKYCSLENERYKNYVADIIDQYGYESKMFQYAYLLNWPVYSDRQFNITKMIACGHMMANMELPYKGKDLIHVSYTDVSGRKAGDRLVTAVIGIDHRNPIMLNNPMQTIYCNKCKKPTLPARISTGLVCTNCATLIKSSSRGFSNKIYTKYLVDLMATNKTEGVGKIIRKFLLPYKCIANGFDSNGVGTWWDKAFKSELGSIKMTAIPFQNNKKAAFYKEIKEDLEDGNIFGSLILPASRYKKTNILNAPEREKALFRLIGQMRYMEKKWTRFGNLPEVRDPSHYFDTDDEIDAVTGANYLANKKIKILRVRKGSYK